MRSNSAHRQVVSALQEGWIEGGSFFGSIIAGTLLGYLADRILGTDPWLLVIGILLGAYTGFMRAWRYSARIEEMVRDRAR